MLYALAIVTGLGLGIAVTRWYYSGPEMEGYKHWIETREHGA